MFSKKILGSLAAIALMAGAFTAEAATVSCPPSPLPVGLNRAVTVYDAALAGGLCYWVEKNLDAGTNPNWNNTNKTLNANGTLLTLLDKTEVANGGKSGTFSFAESYLTSQARIFVGFHFGNGSGSPDSFVLELDKSDWTDIRWALLPVELANGLSNLYIFGIACTTPGGCRPPTDLVPEPATLALLGFGLMGVGFARRRRKA